MKQLLFVSVVALSLFFASAPVQAATGLPEGFSLETVTADMTATTSIAFAPDGRIFIAQKEGVVRVAEADGTLLTTPLIDLSSQTSSGYTDRGLIGIAVDPQFSANGYIYLSYTFENDSSNPDGKKTARVVRVTVDGDTADPSTEKVILGTVRGTPQKPSCADYAKGSDCIASDAWSHTVGGLRFGADGKLYVSTGDGAGFTFSDPHAFRSQDLDHLSGKILRINTDGTGVSDNPFYTGDAADNRSKVFAYGLRNPYRFNFRPGTDDLYVADVGWGEREELDFVEPGKNYGWPCREGDIENVGYSHFSGCPITTSITEPVYVYNHVQTDHGKIGAITGGAFATSAMYPPSFRHQYVFGDFALNFMKHMTLDGGTAIPESDVTTFASDFEKPVEFVTSPDGIIYVLTFSYTTFKSTLSRIMYTDGPQAVIDVSGTDGEAPFTVAFDGTASTHPDGLSLEYTWDFGDGNSASGAQTTHTFNAVGEYPVSLTVRGGGRSAVATEVITVTEPYDGGYDVDPHHVSTTIATSSPYYLGTPVELVTRVGNRSGTDTFSIHFEVRSLDGSHYTQYDQVFPEEGIAAGSEKLYDVDFFLPVGEYTVSVLFTSPDGTQAYDWVGDVATMEIVPRTPQDSGPLPPKEPADPTSHSSQSLYRFWSETYKGHFYTTSVAEKEALERSDSNWQYEGVAYAVEEASTSGASAVYRFWSETYKGHFYTSSVDEKALVETDSNWRYEGIAYYVYLTDSSERKPVYRFWSEVYKHHFYTSSLAERDTIIADDSNWLYEGVAWYIGS